MRSFVAFFVCLFPLSVAAQEQPPAKTVVPLQSPPAAAAPSPQKPPPVNLEEGGQPLNIRLDVSVTDQSTQGTAQPRSLMVLLVDRAVGRTRAAFQDRSIAVDARPVMVDGRIRVNLTIQSDHFRHLATDPEDPTMNWRNSFSLLLENGKPLVVLETNDAVTKRKMSIEVKATIQK